MHVSRAACVPTETRQRSSLRGQSFGSQSVFACLLESFESLMNHLLGFLIQTLSQKCSCARFIHLSRQEVVAQFDQQFARTIKMLVSFIKPAESEEQKPYVIFHRRQITRVPRLLIMKTRGGILDQRAIRVIRAVFLRAEALQVVGQGVKATCKAWSSIVSNRGGVVKKRNES